MIFVILFVLLGFSFSQETYYCVQLASSTRAEDLKRLFLRVKDLPKARVEKIQGLYTLRVGFYKDKERAKKLLKVAKERKFRDAFLRTCYYIPERIILSNFLRKPLKVEEPREGFYRLLVQSLLGGGKIRKALEAIEKALNHFPRSPYWWKLYGDVLLWNSKPEEALRAYLKAYELSPSKSLAKKIFNLSLSLGRFDVAKKLMEVVNAPPKVRIYIYESTGDIDNLIKYLKELRTKEALIILAEIEFMLGEKEEAIKALELHDKLYGPTPQSVLLRAHILFSERKFKESLLTLKRYYKDFKSNPEYLRTLSDLAWMLGDYDTSWEASEKLISLGKGEDVDYERLLYKYTTSQPKKAIELSLRAYEKFRKVFFLEAALFTAFNNGLWREVIEIAQKYKEIILENPYAFTAYITALDKLGRTQEALELTERYLRNYFNKEVLRFYIYLLAEKKNFKKLKRLLRDYAGYEREGELALAFAYAYTVLQKGRKALSVYKYSAKKDEVLYGDILYLLGKEEEARHHRFRSFKRLKRELRENPELLKNPEFLRTFLSLGMEFMHPAEFEKLLERAKKLLSKAVWQEIYISYLMYREQKPRVEWLARVYKYPLKPWVWLNLALENNDKILIQRLVEKEIENLPIRDRVEALRRLGEPYKALYYAFLGLEDNPEDYKLYKQFRDLTVDWASNYELQTTYYSRKNLKELRTSFGWKRRVNEEGLFLGLKLFYGKPLEKQNLRRAPERKELKLGVERVLNRGKLGLELGMSGGLRDNPYFSLYFSRLIRKKLLTEIKLAKNARSEETLYLYLGGMKDYVNLSLNYPFTNRLFGYFAGEYALFRAQDGTRVGEGLNFYGELSYKLRAGYPDYTFRVYSNYGSYTERDSKGVIKEISPYDVFNVLPEDFLSFGVGFLFGYENRYSFVRVWRPFMSLDLGYNTGIKGLFFGGSLGVGGLIFGQDNLSLGIDYMENRGGVKEGILNLNLLYRRWY
ncbi:tetratricopeptide repeat protein [Aquifex sp.]